MPEALRYAERQAAGLCTSCGRRKSAKDRARCRTCLAAAASAAAASRALAAQNGLCDACMRRKRVAGCGARCKACYRFYLARQLAREKAQRAAKRRIA